MDALLNIIDFLHFLNWDVEQRLCGFQASTVQGVYGRNKYTPSRLPASREKLMILAQCAPPSFE